MVALLRLPRRMAAFEDYHLLGLNLEVCGLVITSKRVVAITAAAVVRRAPSRFSSLPTADQRCPASSPRSLPWCSTGRLTGSMATSSARHQ